jgi:hypothetical protein
LLRQSSKESHGSYSSADSDYAAYLGDDCLCLKSFEMKGGKCFDIVLYMASEKETARWSDVLDWSESADGPLIKKAQCPILKEKSIHWLEVCVS